MAEALGTASQALRELPSASYPATSTTVLPVLTSGFRHIEPSQIPRCTTPLQDCLHFMLLFRSNFLSLFCASVQFSRSVMSESLQPHGLQHARPPCQSSTPGVYSNPMSIDSVMPSNHLILCHPLLLLPSIFPSIRIFSFLMSRLFASGGQRIGTSASASVLPMKIQG